jgi:hypothetical protein
MVVLLKLFKILFHDKARKPLEQKRQRLFFISFYKYRFLFQNKCIFIRLLDLVLLIKNFADDNNNWFQKYHNYFHYYVFCIVYYFFDDYTTGLNESYLFTKGISKDNQQSLWFFIDLKGKQKYNRKLFKLRDYSSNQMKKKITQIKEKITLNKAVIFALPKKVFACLKKKFACLKISFAYLKNKFCMPKFIINA